MTSTMPLPSIDFDNLAQLKSRMSAFTTRFDQFIIAGREQLRKERDEFATGMAEDRLLQRTNQQAIEATLREQKELEATLQNEKLEVHDMQASIEDYSAKRNKMIEYKDALEQQTQGVQEIMNKKREVMAAKRHDLTIQNVKNKPELQTWETQLGMRIESAGTDMLRFEFSRINDRDINMPHSFVIDLATSMYAVTECQPQLSTMQAIEFRALY
ncbi:Putative uncharacterized protein [Taphrina deformans PYCC 5710]|uniref:Kinetochore protein SPC25 n=1 Tax=Taphrina deformans (strain PYCC 5710 / ATCC 11124 / CBS 356.35 / IMI 108563 / JCM 9778 / NBRC 8474) TaxID=1097556 RepID=R4X7E1_TAPDE|nr:Putative uncharacterized protein [Taphrina deformans PYCC 5710]|eukprot:CCG81003.1 Putative uncharacterized protein [Taphrina deformans PYCC 5710]